MPAQYARQSFVQEILQNPAVQERMKDPSVNCLSW